MRGGGKGSYLGCTKLGSKADPSVSAPASPSLRLQERYLLGLSPPAFGKVWNLAEGGGAKYSLDPPLG